MKKGISIIIGLIITQIAFAQQPIDKKTIEKIVQNTITAIRNNYVYSDKALLITNHLEKEKRAGKYNDLNDPKSLADKLETDIRSVQNDKHLRIEFNPKLEKDIVNFNLSQQNANSISEADIEKEKSLNFYFRKLEILSSNIGYIEFTNFATPNPDAQKTINSAMQFVSNTDALIIDLRNNRGGKGEMLKEILGYFFNSKIKTGRTFNRIDSKWTDNYIEVNKDLFLKMPLYILTSKKTFSAGEAFAYILKNHRDAKIIGSPTSGGAHLTRSFSLENGFVGFIPYTRSEDIKTNTDWEGIGVIPDINADYDNSIYVAQNEILQSKLLSASEPEQKKITWLINYNKSVVSNIELESSKIDKFVGRFAEFEITRDGNNLLFRDVNQSNKKYFEMKAITPSFFQVGNDYQVEFIETPENRYDIIKMSWNDGWTEEIKRNN